MSKFQQTPATVRRLEDIPNIGKAVADDLRRIGVATPADLWGRDPYALYAGLNAATGMRHDPCVLDTFIAATRFPERLRATASIHPGGIVTADPASPHLSAGAAQARMYFGVAKDDMGSIRTGRANPAMFNKVHIEYYGALTPITRHTQLVNAQAHGGTGERLTWHVVSHRADGGGCARTQAHHLGSQQSG